MQLRQDFLDFVSVTAHFRHQQSYAALRQAFDLTPLDWQNAILLTIECSGKGCYSGIIVAESQAYEFHFSRSGLALKRVSQRILEQDPILSSFCDELEDSSLRERTQSKVEEMVRTLELS